MRKIINVAVLFGFGLATVSVAMAFSGPVTHPPAGNPNFWMKSGNDVYYNITNGNIGIGTNGPTFKLDVQNGQINSSGGLCIAGICKTDWNQIAGYWTLNGSSLYPSLTSYILGVGTVSLDSNYKITTSGGGIKAESASQPAGYFSSVSGYGLIVNSGNVGIGTTNPGVKLEVAGQVKIADGSQGTSKVLTSDTNGLASWQTFAGGAITGEIKIWSVATAPAGYLLCDGSAVSRTTYANLFAVIGTTYGSGDGSTTFNLPNLKGNVPAGYDAVQSEFNTLGKTGGEKTHTLTIAEMPAHSHLVQAEPGGGTGAYQLGSRGSPGTIGTDNRGGNGAHNNLQPYITLIYIIKF